MELIRSEASRGTEGRIVWKLNNLVDPGIIEALYEASAAGVQIDLLVRAICCLRPGVRGLSDNIRVRSIVDRWLEHSRIYYFGAGTPPSEGLGGGEFYIGSADMMDRNLDRRVEAVVPISSPELAGRLREILLTELVDDMRSWELDGDGKWHKVAVTAGISAQERLQELALARSRR